MVRNGPPAISTPPNRHPTASNRIQPPMNAAPFTPSRQLTLPSQLRIEHWIAQSERLQELQIESPPRHVAEQQLQRYQELRRTIDLTGRECDSPGPFIDLTHPDRRDSDSTIIIISDSDAESEATQVYPNPYSSQPGTPDRSLFSMLHLFLGFISSTSHFTGEFESGVSSQLSQAATQSL